MELSAVDVASLPLGVIRAFLPDWVARHVEAGPEVHGPMRADIEALLRATPDAALEAMRDAYRDAGETYRLYRADPAARQLTRAFMRRVVAGVDIEGRDRLARFLAEGPRRRMIVANHLSYTDTQVTDVVLAEHGLDPLAARLVAIAGPKVYTDPWRRMAAIALNTRKTAQSSAVATEQDAIGVRELAAIAHQTIEDCARLMDDGWVILLYPEGSRSRTGRLRPFLRAAARYLHLPDLQVLTMAQTGTERIFPIDDPMMHPGPVRLAFGEPMDTSAFPGKTGPLAEAHARLCASLPETYRPEPGEPAVG